MNLVNNLTYNGINTTAYGVFLSGEGAYNSPAKRGEIVEIPGRSGALFMDERTYENIEVTYPALIGTNDASKFRTALRSLRSDFSAVKTYARLVDTYHPDEYRLGLFRAGVETEPTFYNRAGSFELVFDCKPQRFLISGDEPIPYTASGSITNPTPFTAEPLIKVTGNGTVRIGDYQFTVKGNTETFWLDSEIMEAYVPAAEVYDFTDENDDIVTDELDFNIEFANGYVVPANKIRLIAFKNHEFPKIEPGMQRVELSGTITIEIVPRWWVL